MRSLSLTLCLAASLALAGCGLIADPALELDNQSSYEVHVRYDAEDRNEDGSILFREITVAPSQVEVVSLARGQTRMNYRYEPDSKVKATEYESSRRIVFEDR